MDEGTKGLGGGGGGDEIVPGVGVALLLPLAERLLQEPEAGEVAQEERGVAASAFVCEAKLAGARGGDGSVEFHAHEAPGAAADERAVRIEIGNGGDCAGCIVRCDGDDGEGLAEAAEVEDAATDIGEDGCGGDNPGQNSIRDGEGMEQFAVPVARGVVVHPGGGGFSELDGFFAAEEKVEEVGNHQEGLGGFEPGVFGKHHGVELEEGVELERLHAGGGEEIGFGDALEEALRDAVGARVAVVRGIVEQAATAVEEGEVYAPGIDGDSGGRVCEARTVLCEAVLNLRPDAQRVPVDAAVEVDAAIGKAVELVEGEPAAIPVAHHQAAAGCAQIDCDEV